MNQESILYLLPYFGSAAISAGIGIFSLRHRDVNGGRPFGIFALPQGSMTLGFTFEIINPSLEDKIFWDNVQFFFLYFSPIFFLSFTFEYTGKKLEYPNRF